MVEGYCAKCKTRREIVDGVEETMNSGRVVYKGACGMCGDEVVKIIGENGGVAEAGGKEAPEPAGDSEATAGGASG